jgi:hypothetical protein
MILSDTSLTVSAMEATMKPRIIILLTMLTLLVVPILQIESAEIKNIRYYSESGKTRIVIQLSDSVQYRTQFDLEQNISISLLKTGFSIPGKLYNIKDGLVETVKLEEAKNNIADVKVLLERPAAFNVFPLEAPARIVIDVIPVDNVLNPEVVAISPSESENAPQAIETKLPEKKEDTAMNESIDVKEPAVDDSQTTDNVGGILSSSSKPESAKTKFIDTKSFVNYGFDVVILVALIYMGIKVKGVSKFARFVRKQGKKGNLSFASALGEMEKEHIQETDKSSKKIGLIPETKNSENEVSEKKIEKDSATKPEAIPPQYGRVQEMAQHGMDSASISQRSDIPVAEVNLILDLIKARRGGGRAK